MNVQRSGNKLSADLFIRKLIGDPEIQNLSWTISGSSFQGIGLIALLGAVKNSFPVVFLFPDDF